MKMKPITDDVLERAARRGSASLERGAASASVNAERHLVIVMRSGARATIPISSIPVPVIAKAPIAKLANVEVGPLGDHIWFPDLDEGYNVAMLLDREFGPTIRADSGRKGGLKKTTAKATAARANGAKGGRPRKAKAST